MNKDNIEFFDVVNENDEIIGRINEDMQNTVKPSQLRFINIMIINDEEKILVPKRSSNRRIFPNCYDFSVGGMLIQVKNMNKRPIENLKKS